MTDLSIIIVNYRGWKHLKVCLDSLAGFRETIYKYEVIVVYERLSISPINLPHLNFIQNIKSNAMTIFGTLTEMKPEALADYFLIIAKQPIP